MMVFESQPCKSDAAGMPMKLHGNAGIDLRGPQLDPYIGITIG